MTTLAMKLISIAFMGSQKAFQPLGSVTGKGNVKMEVMSWIKYVVCKKESTQLLLHILF